MRYVQLEELVRAHEILLKKYGGSAGIRDYGLLESAVHRPQASVFGEDAYPAVFDKAAAVCHSLLMSHPFVDGNKRTAFAACHLTLLLNGWDLTSDSNETYAFLIRTIKNRLAWQEISSWLKTRSQKRKQPGFAS
ncbi:MAG: type II toxin-antitoxin system death-on-curing family toxin [Candidatus Omnitrophica bacterium]|nr:type II toxin-antitoxin system death-on-curing family toxin [Candidatus Omnitrophota bacterium]